jgi:hypothetical protein
MPYRDDEEFEVPDASNGIVNNKEYVDSLKASGNDPESQPTVVMPSRLEGRAYRPYLNVRVLLDTFEVKTTLRSRAELEGLKSLMTKYFSSPQFRGAKVELLTGPAPELLFELKLFCTSFKEKRPVPFGVRLVYQGKGI